MHSTTISLAGRTMMNDATHSELTSALRRATHPPLREGRFWVVQVMVLLIATLHFCAAAFTTGSTSSALVGISISVWIVPVLYSALRYGLMGSAATSLWTVALWLTQLGATPRRRHAHLRPGHSRGRRGCRTLRRTPHRG